MPAERTALLAAVCAAMIAPIPLRAAPGAPGVYERTFNVVFSGYNGTTTLTNFPALVRVSETLNEFSYSSCRLPQGGDLRFFDGNGRLLPSEVELWDTDGESLVWVKVPELAHGTVITARYGCASPDPMTPSDVWDGHYLGVWHLGAGPDAATQPDSTSNGESFHIESAYTDGVDSGVSGAVGYAAAFHRREDGFGAYFIGPNHGGGNAGRYSGLSAFTIEFWTKEDNNDKVGTAANNPYIMKMGDIWHSYRNTSDGRLSLNFLRDGQTAGNWLNGAASEATPTPSRWNHTARVYDGDPETRTVNRAAYLNGASQTGSWTSPSLDGAMKAASSPTFALGGGQPADGYSFPGAIDEVRISDIARSADWVKATYDTVSNPIFAVYEMPQEWKKYSHRFYMTFSGAPDRTTLADFPVLVRLSEDSPRGFRYADCRKSDGGDLRFCVENGKSLPCEVEMWNTNGESLVWVKVPELTRGTILTAYYGWESAPAVAAARVWDDHFLAVWHLNAAPGGTVQPDSTTNGHPFGVNTNYSDGVACGADGIAGLAAATGLRSDGKGCFSISDPDHFLNRFSAFTIEAWTRQDHHNPSDSGIRRYILRRGGQVNYDWQLYENPEGRSALQIEALGGREILPEESAAIPERAAWNYTAVQWDGTFGECAGYLNGSALALAAQSVVAARWKGTIGEKTTGLNLGNFRYDGARPVDGVDGDAFRGAIDEVRISDVMRSPDWVQATHDTIRPGSGFATYSSASRNIKPTSIRIR